MSSPPIETLFERLYLIRKTEEALLRLFSEGKLHGTTHTSLGQEAIAVAAGAHLREGDMVFASHRCHGHFLSYGGPLESLLAEVMGREGGVCEGRGGSQHLVYKRFFSSGVQGGIVGNATGAALGLQHARSGAIAVAFLGDGTLGEGLVYESLNFAALRQLPVLFILEDNGIAQTTPATDAVSGSMLARAEAFGIAASEIESNDVLALLDTLGEAFRHVRERGAPFFQVVHTYRLGPHSKGDDTRDRAEVEHHRAGDPITLLGAQVDSGCAREIEQASDRTVRDAIQTVSARAAARSADFEESEGKSAPVPFAAQGLRYGVALNRALQAILGEEPAAILMGEDLADPYGGAFKVAKGLSTRYPDRVISTPISEAGLVAWGVGAALAGMRPIVEIMFGDFLALAADQILNHAAKYSWVSGGRQRLPLVIRTPMGGGRGYGPTHSQCLEKMFLGVPGLTVVAASPLLDPGELLRRACLAMDSPVLFIEHKLLYPQELYAIESGRCGDFFVRATSGLFPTLRLSLTDSVSCDAALITYGGAVKLALEAATMLLIEEEIALDVIVPSVLGPARAAEIASILGCARHVATLEEGSRAAGWGAEVIAGLAEDPAYSDTRFLRIAAADTPVPAAKQLEAETLPGLDSTLKQLRSFLR